MPHEDELRRAWQAGDLTALARGALGAYGPEIFGLLGALLRDEADAQDAWAQFAEDLWRGLPRFRYESSVRTWAYAIARHAATKVRLNRNAGARRQVALSASPVSQMAAEIQERTATYLRTQAKSELTELRSALKADDQLLLVLRVDRAMSWDEIAVVMGEGADDGTLLERRSALLRKRFQLVKDRLRREAQSKGLLRDDG